LRLEDWRAGITLTPLRRAISLACAFALTAGGVILLYLELSSSGQGPRKFALVPLFMIGVGAAWFFSDLFRKSE
jgi:hypothetical protein